MPSTEPMRQSLLTTPIMTRWVLTCARLMREQQAYLTQLDSAIGDADHGANMTRGFNAAEIRVAELGPETLPGEVLVIAGQTLVTSIGGASGPLWGAVFRRTGKSLAGLATVNLAQFAAALDKGLVAVMELGTAEPGDKTMVDALSPAVDSFRAATLDGLALGPAIRQAQVAATQGALNTTPMLARKGRASYLGERSVGHQDPGAASTALIVSALHLTFQELSPETLEHSGDSDHPDEPDRSDEPGGPPQATRDRP